MLQLEAVAAAGAIALAVALAYRVYGWRAARLAVQDAGALAGFAAQRGEGASAYVLYFTSETCTICKTHQEPALAQLPAGRVRKVDALADPDLARRFHVYTVPTTVVIGPDGRPLHVNYGYAPATRLREQLAGA